jgi:hypothetical protein
LRGLLHKAKDKQGGSVAVISAMFMLVIIGITGFVIDFGISYVDGAKLQNSLDSAVLAAVKELPADSVSTAAWSAAEDTAVYYALQNGIDIGEADISPLLRTSGKISGIKASKSITVNYIFIRVLGIKSGTLTRSSSAGLIPAGGIKGAVPLCVTSASLINSIASGMNILTIKCSSQTSDLGIDSSANGWFGALSLDGSGASNYSNLLAYGYAGILNVGQLINMENGNMSGPTMDGFTTRMSSCTNGCTAANHLSDCPKLVYVPVVETVSNKQVRVVSFACFFLLECGGSGGSSYIKAVYIDSVVLPDEAAGKVGQDFGVYTSKLLN